jgi:hypothetical protein
MENAKHTGMTDHLHLVNQIAHHDAAIGALGARMTGVESTLSHVQDKVMSLDTKVSGGFSSLESLIRENKATQGPGISDVMRGVATGGAIIAMSAGAITMLVTSFVKPELVELQIKTNNLEKIDERRTAAEHSEREELRERRRQQIDETIEKLTNQTFRLNGAWATETKKEGGL